MGERGRTGRLPGSYANEQDCEIGWQCRHARVMFESEIAQVHAYTRPLQNTGAVYDDHAKGR